MRFLLIHAHPAAAPAAIIAMEAGPVWPTGPVEGAYGMIEA